MNAEYQLHRALLSLIPARNMTQPPLDSGTRCLTRSGIRLRPGGIVRLAERWLQTPLDGDGIGFGPANHSLTLYVHQLVQAAMTGLVQCAFAAARQQVAQFLLSSRRSEERRVGKECR